jgi:hypothetical protein
LVHINIRCLTKVWYAEQIAPTVVLNRALQKKNWQAI